MSASAFKEVDGGMQGHTVTIDKWLDAEKGVCITREGYPLIFHINHMWVKVDSSNWTEMREVYSATDIRTKNDIGKKVRCQYRKIDLGNYSYQVTAMWKDGTGPAHYRTKDYFEDLQRIANNQKNNRNTTSNLFSRCRSGAKSCKSTSPTKWDS